MRSLPAFARHALPLRGHGLLSCRSQPERAARAVPLHPVPAAGWPCHSKPLPSIALLCDPAAACPDFAVRSSPRECCPAVPMPAVPLLCATVVATPAVPIRAGASLCAPSQTPPAETRRAIPKPCIPDHSCRCIACLPVPIAAYALLPRQCAAGRSAGHGDAQRAVSGHHGYSAAIFMASESPKRASFSNASTSASEANRKVPH